MPEEDADWGSRWQAAMPISIMTAHNPTSIRFIVLSILSRGYRHIRCEPAGTLYMYGCTILKVTGAGGVAGQAASGASHWSLRAGDHFY